MFSSPEAALRFAFRMRGKSIISSPSGVFTSKEKMKVRNENSLTAYDFHAQAGMIFGKIDRMPQDQQLWIFLTYGDKNERKVCAEQLAEVLVSNPDAVKNHLSKQDVQKILTAPSVRTCAAEVGLTNYKAFKLRSSFAHSMERQMLRALDDLWEWLESGRVKA